MNMGKTPLEDSLKLFEEAEKLIRSCSSRLVGAEQKIDMLIKGRSGEVVLDAEQKPRTEPFGQNKGASPSPLQQPPIAPPMRTLPKSPPMAAAIRSEPSLIQTNDELPF